MAAIYSGIHLKLKSPQTSWEDKIKLARFAWISSQCLLPNKEQVLLDWSIHALTGWYNKKVDFSHSVLESLWCYLDDLLHSRKLHSFLKQGKSISLRLNMAQLLFDRLWDYAQANTVAAVGLSTLLSVCHGILSTPALSSVFTTKYEMMVSLLDRLISVASRQLQPLLLPGQSTLIVQCKSELGTTQSQPDCDPNKVQHDPGHPDNLSPDCYKYTAKSTENLASAKLFEVLLLALTNYLAVQRQQTNPNRVFTLVANQLFQPLIFLRHLLTSDTLSSRAHLVVSLQMCRDIRTKIDTILQLALFPPEHMSLYQEEFSKVDSGKRGSGATKGCLRPAYTILNKLTALSICEPPIYYAVKTSTVSVLFKLFVESYGIGKGGKNEEQGMLGFFFLASLLGALDLALDLEQLLYNKKDQQECPSPHSAPCSPESWSLALLAIESLLNSALSADIYNVAADRIRHGEVQLRIYRALAEMLLKQAQPSIPSWYRCLKALLNLNHLILEPEQELLLSLAWVKADCKDTRILRAKQLTVCSLLQTYTKLRQLPQFFSHLLTVICQPGLDQVRPPLFSEEVTTSIRTCLLDTPPSQTLEICSLVLKSIKKHIPPSIKPETLAKEMSPVNEVTFDAGSSFKILSLSQLLHSVLFSLKTLDNASPLPLVRQTQNFMKTMHLVIEDLHQLLTEIENQAILSVPKMPKKIKKKQVLDSQANTQSKQNVLEATLLLRYTCVEVDTLFSIHCSKYTSLNPVFLTSSSENEDHTTSESSVACIENLLSGKTFSPSIIACSPLSFLLLRHLVLQQIKKVLLDPSMFANSSTKAVLNQAAHFITAKDDIEKCLNVYHNWDGQIQNVNAVTYLVAYWHLVTSNLPLLSPYLDKDNLHCISKLLVGSQLMKPLRDTLPNCLTVFLISYQFLKSPFFPELPSLFSVTVQFVLQSLTEVLRAAHKHKACAIFQDYSEIQKEMLVESILANLTSGETFIELSNSQTKDVLNLLQIIENLNPDGMSSDDLSACFLLLIFILSSTSFQRNDEGNPDKLSVLTLLHKLLRLQCNLLEGANFPNVLKFIHGGTLLQIAVSSLLGHRVIFAESSEWLDLVMTMQVFIKRLVQLIVSRSSSVRLNLNQFASYLSSKEIKQKLKMAPSESDATSFSDSVLTTHILLASLSAFSQTLTANLSKSKQLDELVTQILTQTTATLGLAVDSVTSLHMTSIISQAFVVEVVTVMLQCELSILSIEESKQEHLVSHMDLYRGFCQQILKESNSDQRSADLWVSSLGFLSTFYTAVEKQEQKGERKELNELFMQMLYGLRQLTVHWPSSTDNCDLERAAQMLLRHLVANCSFERFNLLLLTIKEGLDSGKLMTGNYREVLSTVTILKLLFNCPLPEQCFKKLWLIAPQMISAIMFLVNASSQDTSLNLPFTVPAITAVTALLRHGEGLIANPHHVTMVFGALQSVPLDHLTPAAYESTFMVIHEALFAIIRSHPQVMLKAAPSFLNVFYRLVASVMQEGKQKDGDTGPDSDIYLQCSRLVERMYSHIAAAAESFTTLSSFIVAHYVTELQKVTLRPDVKLHLTEGIYLILDLCLEQDIKFLMAGLSAGVRVVFNELYSSYTHYHKTQRQGEDKYTV